VSTHYQELDAKAFDYHLGLVPGAGDVLFRGPVADTSRPFIAAIGGAQTFGRFAQHPFPELVAQQLGVPCLNLGLGGAGPRFAMQPQMLSLLLRARLVIVQMFSGRSASNSLFDNTDGRNAGRVVATGDWTTFEHFLDRLLQREDRELTERTVRETRDDYVFDMSRLGRALRVPTVLLWLSRRPPEYDVDWSSAFGILNSFPQLIDRGVVDRIRPLFGDYVECTSEAGIPQRLWRAAEPVLGTQLGDDGFLWNDYYPSPEMHSLAAERLVPACRRLLG
jgi:hypothetical protein